MSDALVGDKLIDTLERYDDRSLNQASPGIGEGSSRAARLGRFIADLPGRANDLMLKSYIAFENDPSGTAKHGVETGIVAAIVSPANEVFRFGVAGAVQAGTGSTIASAVSIVAVTALTEGVGTLASADLMDSDNGHKAVSWLNGKLDKVTRGKITEGKRLGPIGEAGLGYFGGTSVALLAKQIEEPSRTKHENKRYGLLMTSWLSGLVGIQWLTGANGFDNPTPANIALGFAGTVGVVAGMKFAKDKSGSRNIDEIEANTEGQ